MAGQQVIAAIGPSYWLRDKKAAVQRSVNWYLMALEETGQVVLESAPGLVLVHDFGDEIRGLHNADGRLFVASGSTLYEWAGSATARGALASGTSRVSMANGEGQLACVDGASLHVLNLGTNTLAAVAAAGWLGSYGVSFMDGYFIFAEPDSERFYWSAIDDASTLDALDFSSSDTQPDDVIAHCVTRRELVLFGSRTSEVWINGGGVDSPFVRYQGTPIDVGIVGRYAYAVASSLVWVGKTDKGGPYFYLLDGYTPRRKSTQAVEQQLEASTDLAGVRCWTYQEAGSEFVAVHIPGAETTWVYDLALDKWHERGEWTDSWAPSRVAHHAYWGDAHYVAGGSKLYRMTRTATTLAGDVLMRERTWAHLVQPSYEAIRFSGLEVRCTTGNELVTGDMSLEISNDGGRIFGAPLSRSLGDPGQYSKRVRWLGLGTVPAGGSRVFRLRCASDVPLTLQGAAVE